jgi:hypothetical protein
MKKKRVHTTWFERDDGLTDEQIKKRAEAIRRKIKMPKTKKAVKAGGSNKVDKEKLKSLLEKGGMTREQLIQELGGVTRLALKNAVLKVMHDAQQYYNVPGLFGKALTNINFTKFGIRIPTNKLEGHFKKGDEFSLKIDKDTILLTKL